MIWHRNEFVITTERPTSAINDTFELLQTTYWSHKRPAGVIEKLLDNSLCFFLLRDTTQVGFGRVITDYVTTSWVSDVVIDSKIQNQGLGGWMMDCIMSHPDIVDTQFALQTGTAHPFYDRLGFKRSDALMSTPVDYL